MILAKKKIFEKFSKKKFFDRGDPMKIENFEKISKKFFFAKITLKSFLYRFQMILGGSGNFFRFAPFWTTFGPPFEEIFWLQLDP